MLFTLIKINIAGLFSKSFKNFKRGKKRSAVSIVLIGLLIVYAIGAVMFSIGAMLYSLCTPFFEAGIGWLYFAIVGLIIFALCFIGGVFMVQSQVFNARDNELLLSMPIKSSIILGGRLTALLMFEYVYEYIILIPAFVVLIICKCIAYIPVTGIILFFAASIFLPLFAIAIGSLFGWIIALLSSKLRRKNVFTLVFSLAFIGAYFWGYTKMMGYMNTLLINGAQIADAVKRAVFPAYHLGVAISDGNILSFLFFAVCAIVPFAVMYTLLSVSFVKITTTKRGARKVEYHEKGARASGARIALIKRELRRYWSMPMYIMNTSLGIVGALAIAVVMLIRPGLITGLFDANNEVFGSITPAIAVAVVLSALSAFNFVSAPSISLEGKTLWIVKSLPVKSREILFSKAAMHVLVCAAPSLIAGVISIAVIPIGSFLQAILIIIAPASVTVMFALFGVALNLSFHRFDWINEIQPIKQGASCMISMFSGMALIMVLVFAYIFLLSSVLSLDLFLLVCVIVFASISAVFYAYIVGAGARKFDAL